MEHSWFQIEVPKTNINYKLFKDEQEAQEASGTPINANDKVKPQAMFGELTASDVKISCTGVGGTNYAEFVDWDYTTNKDNFEPDNLYIRFGTVEY